MEEKSSWFEMLVGGTIALEEIIKQQEEDRAYIKNIARMFGKDKHDSYIYAQFVIISIHMKVDKTISEVMARLLDIGVLPLNIEADTSELEDILLKTSFEIRFKLLKSLKIFKSETYTFMSEINRIRNNFAHPRPKKEGQFEYRNKSVLNKQGIELITADYEYFVEEWGKTMNRYVTFLRKGIKNDEQ